MGRAWNAYGSFGSNAHVPNSDECFTMNPKNPYAVLGLSPDATPGDVERQGKKLLGLLEVGAEKAKSYAYLGSTLPRDATMVREAMAALRDPKRAVRERCLARLLSGSPASRVVEPDEPFADAFLAGGYQGL
jgi:hypothetical protein